MELRQLRYFVAVAEIQHFGKAAEHLFISQPALSQQISLLENYLGVELFDHHQRKVFRKVKLTPSGEFLLQQSKILLAQIKSVEEQTKILGLQRRPLRFGVYKALLKERISEYLEQYALKNPEQEITIIEFENYTSVQEALLQQEIDQGITLLPLIDKRLKSTFLKSGNLCLIIPKNRKAELQQMPLEELLKNERWVELSPRFHPVYHEIEAVCKHLNISRQIVQEVSAMGLLISLVNVGQLIAFAPALMDFSHEPNIAVIPLDNTPFAKIELRYVLAELSD